MSESWLLGLETELFTIDRKGKMVSKADLVIRAARKPGMVKKECAKNMVEVLAMPSHSAREVMRLLIANIQHVQRSAHRIGLHLFPFGTYPGAFVPEMRSEGGYGVKRKVFGKRFAIGGRCIGFHCHYDTPSVIPFAKDISILGMLDIRQQQSILNGYNFLIASDPGLSCLMQSSPFYQGLNIGKDSRVIVYRGGKDLRFPLGMYADYEAFGQLQGYKHSMTDIIGTIEDKFDEWTTLVRALGFNLRVFAKYGSVLSTSWNPIKINPHNTLEQRGMDMNLPSHIAAATTMIKSCLSRIYTEHLEVHPSNKGIRRPFSLEGERINVPPEEYVRKILQPLGAYRGLSDARVAAYCKGLFKLAESSVDKDERIFLKPFKVSVTEKKTMSDIILKMAKQLGWQKGTMLAPQEARDLAIKACHQMITDISHTLSILD